MDEVLEAAKKMGIDLDSYGQPVSREKAIKTHMEYI
jgi:hypothetical protein